MDRKQKNAVKKCFNAVSALVQERKDVNTQINEEFKITSKDIGWSVQGLKNGFSLYKRGVRLEDINELYEVFVEMDSPDSPEEDE